MVNLLSEPQFVDQEMTICMRAGSLRRNERRSSSSLEARQGVAQIVAIIVKQTTHNFGRI